MPLLHLRRRRSLRHPPSIVGSQQNDLLQDGDVDIDVLLHGEIPLELAKVDCGVVSQCIGLVNLQHLTVELVLGSHHLVNVHAVEKLPIVAQVIPFGEPADHDDRVVRLVPHTGRLPGDLHGGAQKLQRLALIDVGGEDRKVTPFEDLTHACSTRVVGSIDVVELEDSPDQIEHLVKYRRLHLTSFRGAVVGTQHAYSVDRGSQEGRELGRVLDLPFLDQTTEVADRKGFTVVLPQPCGCGAVGGVEVAARDDGSRHLGEDGR